MKNYEVCNFNRESEIDRMTHLEKINEIVYQLPREVLEDINKRIGDWLASGGGENDPYIEQQLCFAQRFIRKE
jgi:hypothetical protein